MRPELLGNDLADLFDEAAPELTLEEVRNRAFRARHVGHPRQLRPSLVALGAFVAVVVTGLVFGFLTQTWDRQSPVVSEPEVISPDLTEPTPIDTTDAPSVRLGTNHVWPETPRHDTPSELAEDFAATVLGWQDIEGFSAVESPDGVSWVRIGLLSDQPERAGVVTSRLPDGKHVIVEAGPPWDRGLDIGAGEDGGIEVRLGTVLDAVDAEIIVRLADGSHLVERVSFDPIDTAPVYADLPQIAPGSVRSVLVRYRDDTGKVVGVNGVSNPVIRQTGASSQDEAVYLADGEELLSTYPTVVAAAWSPEPQFDTSDLGEEVTLAPITDVAELLRRTWGWATHPNAEIIRITVLGTTPDGTEAFVMHTNETDWLSGDPSQTRWSMFGEEATGIGGSSPRELADAPGGLQPPEPWDVYGGGPGWMPHGRDGRVHVWWRVPPETSVVVMTWNGGQSWQRPIDATAIFKYESAFNIEFRALNSLGETIATHNG